MCVIQDSRLVGIEFRIRENAKESLVSDNTEIDGRVSARAVAMRNILKAVRRTDPRAINFVSELPYCVSSL